MSGEIDYGILGGGLAGCALAGALLARNRSVVLLDSGSLGSGASGTPGALVNLATGRRGTRVWKAAECYDSLCRSFTRVSSAADEPFYFTHGVLRPALTEKMADKMREQYEKTDWDPAYCRWLNRGEILERHPDIQCVKGGLWLPAGMSVNAEAYLQGCRKDLRSSGALIREHCRYECLEKKGRWQLRTEKEIHTCNRVIFAIGEAMVKHPWWTFLNLHPVKGQVALFESERDLSFNHSVSSLGYIARLNHPKRFVMGSTYEHDFNSAEPDMEGERYLRKRLRRTLPELESRSKIIDRWAGVRVTTPDRKPVIGEHPRKKGIYCFTGLGSKGLLYSHYLGERMVGWLEGDRNLPEAVALHRLLN